MISKNLAKKVNDNALGNNFKGKCFIVEEQVTADPEYASVLNKPVLHSVQFNNDGEVYQEYLLLNGQNMTMPREPVKEAGEQHTYKCSSWVKTGANVVYDSSATVNADVTLEASYDAIVNRDAVILWSASTAETVLQNKALENYYTEKASLLSR